MNTDIQQVLSVFSKSSWEENAVVTRAFHQHLVDGGKLESSVENIDSSGLLWAIISGLEHKDNGAPSEFVYECIKLLGSIAGTRKGAETIFQMTERPRGIAVPKIASLLTHQQATVREEAAWCIAKMTSHDSNDIRKSFLEPGLKLERTLLQFSCQSGKGNLRLKLFSAYTLSNLEKGTKSPDYDSKKVSIVVRMLGFFQEVQFQFDEHCRMMEAVFHCIGNLMPGSDHQAQLDICAQLLPRLQEWLQSKRNASLKAKACWLAARLVAGSIVQLEWLLAQDGLFELLLNVATTDRDWIVRKEALRTISSAFASGSQDQVVNLIEKGALAPLINILSADDEVEHVFKKEITQVMIRALRVYQNHPVVGPQL